MSVIFVIIVTFALLISVHRKKMRHFPRNCQIVPAFRICQLNYLRLFPIFPVFPVSRKASDRLADCRDIQQNGNMVKLCQFEREGMSKKERDEVALRLGCCLHAFACSFARRRFSRSNAGNCPQMMVARKFH